ncbi:pirin-like protein [Phalaenopsis equestris]|uniref:pirin-like protein n=1 Tax=Phalaenopsis equestris TaxID=78828 RepID=UPI0009E339C1|nr:pirin-like protein [Phalaenopsis equestris]
MIGFITKSFAISSSINPHHLSPHNPSIKPFFSKFKLSSPNPKSNPTFLTEHRKNRVSTIMSITSRDHAADSYEIPQIMKPRSVVKKVLAREQPEGEGATVRRSIGRPEHQSLDPFLMLDYATVAHPARFPFHPHRGIETVTYGLEGEISHEDFDGRKGVIRPGDVQWMTAGRGIVHAGKPIGDTANKNFQLWINLSSKDKMVEPSYQELQSENIKRVQINGVDVRIIAGEAFGVRSPIHTRTPTMYLDITMNPGALLHKPIPEDWNAFFYVVDGEGVFGDEGSSPVSGHHNLVLSKGDGVRVWNRSEGKLRFLLIAGQPLDEPVVKYGPFVMNTREEIEQAFVDYQLCKNGFEKAKQLKFQD